MSLSKEKRRQLFEKFTSEEAKDSVIFTLYRNRHEPGRSFSEDAINEVAEMIHLFVGGRIMNRWEKTKEPPEQMDIEVTVRHVDRRLREGQQRT